MWFVLASALAADLTAANALYAWGEHVCARLDTGGDRCWRGARAPAVPRTEGLGDVPEPPFPTRRLRALGDSWCAIGDDGQQACIGRDWRYAMGAAPGTTTTSWVQLDDAPLEADEIPAPGPQVRVASAACRLTPPTVTCSGDNDTRALGEPGQLPLHVRPGRPDPLQPTCRLEATVVHCPPDAFPRRRTVGPIAMQGIDRLVGGPQLFCGLAGERLSCRGATPSGVVWTDAPLDHVVDVAVARRVVALRRDGSLWTHDRGWTMLVDGLVATRVAADDQLACAWREDPDAQDGGRATCFDADGRSASFEAAPPSPDGERVCFGRWCIAAGLGPAADTPYTVQVAP